MTDSANGVSVRPVRPDETSWLWEMVHALARYERLEHEVVGTAEGLRDALFGTPRRLEGLVAEQGGRRVGYALVYEIYSSFHARPALWLEDLFVEEAARGRGAGRALLAEVARLARERGHPRVGWMVLDWNQPSIQFYERLGAKPTADTWLIYGLDEPEIEALAGEAPAPTRESRERS